MHRRIARTTLLVAVALTGVACTKTLDTTNLKSSLQSQLQSDLGSPNFVVHCPDSVKVLAGSTFTCTATGPGGQSLTLLITQKDDKGTVNWKISGASGGSSPTPIVSPTS